MQDNKNSMKNIFDAAMGKEAEDCTEFVFGSDPGEEEKAEDGVEFSFGTEAIEETDAKKNGTKLEFDDKKEERAPEFSVPERFVVDEKYDVPSSYDEAPRIITTYVPRFTDASRNYKMRDGSAPASDLSRVKTKLHDEATREYAEDVDPTAEIDLKENAIGAVVVGSRKSEDAKISASTVFKFAPDVPAETEETEPTAVFEAEASDIDKEKEIIKEIIEKSEDAPAAPRYSIPDPDDDVLGASELPSSTVISYSSVPEDAPYGIGDPLPTMKHIKEYDAISKRESFKERFLDKILSLKVRFFAVAAIALFALVFECMVAFGVDLALALGISGISGAIALLDAQFVIALFLLTMPETVGAISALIRKKLTGELYLTAALLVIAVYTVIIVAAAPISYPLFGFLYSVYALCAIASSYFKASTDFTAFKRVWANGEKTVADTKLTRTLERENIALDGKIEEYKSCTVRTFRTMFVSDFFKRVSMPVGRNKSVALILGCSLALSLVTAVVSFFIPGGWYAAASAFALVFLLACPAFSILMNKLPAYHAELEIDREKSAIIGEKAMFDYAATDVMTFSDTEVFGSEDVSLQRINVNGHNDNLEKALRQMSALFMCVGGPLETLFSNALDRKCPPAVDVQIFDEGIIGIVDGSTVFAGTLGFMKENGIKVLLDKEGRIERQSDSTKIMYAAEKGEAYAKFYIRYSFSEEFSMLLPILDDYGITPLVYTRDPNVSRRLLMTLTAGVDKIRVMKKTDAVQNGDVKYKSVSSSLVSGGDRSNIINSILIAKKFASTVNRFRISELISMAVGGALAVVLTLGGMTLVPSVALGAWHLIWCCAFYFISKKGMHLDE